jgi:anti-sigma regulatory factor (Ser/Thr protein kinase)
MSRGAGVMTQEATRSLRLPPTALSSTRARRFVLSALADWGLTSLRDTAALLTSEVVTNSVLHARTDFDVVVSRLDDGIAVEVTDGSQRAPIRRRQVDEATTGRGVDLLQQLATEWDVTLHESGKTVRFILSESVDPWAPYTGTEWAAKGGQR